MAKVKLTKSKFQQGIYIPKNPEKYIGNSIEPIIYRSSWERRLCVFLDDNPSVIGWNSESLVIPYLYSVDNKVHKYHIDFIAKMVTRTGEVKTYVIEIKPYAETLVPTTKSKKRLLTEAPTYVKNQDKWAAATKFCTDRGLIFIVLTEYDLGIKKRKQ